MRYVSYFGRRKWLKADKNVSQKNWLKDNYPKFSYTISSNKGQIVSRNEWKFLIQKPSLCFKRNFLRAISSFSAISNGIGKDDGDIWCDGTNFS